MGYRAKEIVLTWAVALPDVTKETEKRLGLDLDEKMSRQELTSLTLVVGLCCISGNICLSEGV